MLNVYFWVWANDVEDYEGNVDCHFDWTFEKEWLTDPIVQQMIKDIDNTTVCENLTLDNPALGGIVPSQLSTGVKTLILLYKTDLKVKGYNLGDNCWEWVFKIAENKELNIAIDWQPPIPNNRDIRILNTGGVVHNVHEFGDVCYSLLADGLDLFEEDEY